MNITQGLAFLKGYEGKAHAQFLGIGRGLPTSEGVAIVNYMIIIELSDSARNTPLQQITPCLESMAAPVIWFIG